VLALIIAIPLGIAQAVRRNSVGDYAATAINFTLYSMPSFFLGLILIQFFALDLHIFPALVSDNITRRVGHSRTRPADPADRDACRAHRRRLQPLHALLGARCPRPGLHPPGARQGSIRACRARAPSAAQRVPADDHARRALDPGAARRQPAHETLFNYPGSGCSSTTPCRTSTTPSCWPTRDRREC
jgi:hypothetical protein